MKKIIITVAIFSIGISVNAQNSVDALRYTQLFPTGSARSVSMGNAFSSLGGDMSSFYSNPAGLGVYRKSEFVFSPGFDYTNSKAEYNNRSGEDFKYNFKLNNIGYVGTYNSNKKTGWVSASFGIAYNQLRDFNNQIIIQGLNQNSSLVDGLLLNIGVDDVYNFSPFSLERLAFDAYVIDYDTAIDQYVTPMPLSTYQRKVINTEGGIGEYSFAFGTNFSHKLYIGIDLSILRVNYNEASTYSEFDQEFSTSELFSYKEDLTTKGSGFTFRMGLIAKPVEFLRIGVSINLPTVYKLEDEYYLSMNTTYHPDYPGQNITIYPTDFDGNTLDVLISDYKIVTPFKATGSFGFQFGKIGLFSVDAEFINYASMRLRDASDGYDYFSENNDITDDFRKVVNLRTGGEVRLGTIALRGGFAYFPSPYKNGTLNENKNYNHFEVSGGVGIRQNNFFIDLGTVYNIHKEQYNLYNTNEPNSAELKQNKLSFVTTIGFRF